LEKSEVNPKNSVKSIAQEEEREKRSSTKK